MFFKKDKKIAPVVQPTDLELILKLQEENTSLRVLLNEVSCTLRAGSLTNRAYVFNDKEGKLEREIFKHITSLQWCRNQYIRLAKLHGEEIPPHAKRQYL